MTGHGKVKALEEEEPRIFDDETIYDYLIQRSNELEHEVMMINETIKLIRELNLKSQNQSMTAEMEGPDLVYCIDCNKNERCHDIEYLLANPSHDVFCKDFESNQSNLHSCFNCFNFHINNYEHFKRYEKVKKENNYFTCRAGNSVKNPEQNQECFISRSENQSLASQEEK